ncbi:MAG TPA: preprotein translocase subunit SecG [Pirellulales bacterium]|jgi:preprotein translocase subunit SecG|nr:preprotein translocase subunit SecG [Pirellulales bacterium]
MMFLIKFLMFFTSLILIVLILLQRGRGGGLAGALGGMGGQSAFGSKAGDVFTRITSGVAIVWIVLCVFALKYFGTTGDLFDPTVLGGAAAPPAQESVERQLGKQKTTPPGPSGSPVGTNSPAGGKKSKPASE